jgi:hypoxanthine phosphoribosyltransferase
MLRRIREFSWLHLTTFFQLVFFGMQHTAGAENLSSIHSGIEDMDNIELLISQDEIKSKITEFAQMLDTQYHNEELTIVMVMKGAICMTADLIRALKTPCTIEYVKASSYGQRGEKRGELKIFGLQELDLSSKNVLLVDDIYDSGETVSQIVAKLKEKKPKSLKSAVLLAKNVARDVNYIPDYILFNIGNQFVIGYGLDYKELYRGLPGIYAFKKHSLTGL